MGWGWSSAAAFWQDKSSTVLGCKCLLNKQGETVSLRLVPFWRTFGFTLMHSAFRESLRWLGSAGQKSGVGFIISESAVSDIPSF